MSELPVSRKQALVAALVLAGVLLVAGKLLLRAGAPTQARPLSPPAAAPQKTPTTLELVINVVGAVRRPGLYRLGQGTRVADAVARAGGPTAKADLESVNLAAPIADGQQVVVPRRARSGISAPGATAPSAKQATPTSPVSLSTATLEELDALPGIGPVTTK